MTLEMLDVVSLMWDAYEVSDPDLDMDLVSVMVAYTVRFVTSVEPAEA